MENLENQQPGRRNRLIRSFSEWWRRNGRSLLIVWAGGEAFEWDRQTEVPRTPGLETEPEPAPEPARNREAFDRWDSWAGAATRGREAFTEEQVLRAIPDGVPDDLSTLGGLTADTQAAAMREWLETVRPEDFGTPPGTSVG